MELDHIAVAGTDLTQAAAHVEAALGVAMQSGGRHALFGTHNRLLGLAEGVYLEAIAVDPAAPVPGRARWFDLDRFEGRPRLTNWICRVDDLDAALARLPAGVGRPVAVSRGDLRWRMAVPEDGVLPFDNLFPALIEWAGDLHPAAMLAPSGCRLTRLTVRHPRAGELVQALAGFSDPRVVFVEEMPGLEARFDTPRGEMVLA